MIGDNMNDVEGIIAKVTRAVELFMPDTEGQPSPLTAEKPSV